MLTVDLVRTRRRGDTLELVALGGATRARAVELAEQYAAMIKAHVGHTRDELDEILAAIPFPARDRKIAGGLRKLIADRCEFEPEPGIEPDELRRTVFQRASAARRALAPGERFDPRQVVADVAGQRGLQPDELDRLLYADLRGAHRLLSFDALPGDSLVELYQLGQAQAVLLRAVRVTARVYCQTPGAYRELFRHLKFRRLLYTIEPLDGPDAGYAIQIDGPYSLFRSVTKYGLQLALLLPALRACDRWSLDAQVLWGKDRKPLSFSLSSDPDHRAAASGPPRLPDEVATLLERFNALHEADKTPWQARPAAEIFALPGVGVCVPDLVFEHTETGVCAYLEVMGFWSRQAVWKRVELVERGLPQQILFAVSSRLRVSEAVLDSDLPSALYVYKGTMSPRLIASKLDDLAARKSPGAPS